MNSWKIILATIVIFGAGVTTGGLLVSHVDRAGRMTRRPPGDPGIRPPGGEHEPGRGMGMELPRPRQPDLLNTNFVKRLDDALKLTAEQRNAIEKIIAEGQDQNHSIWTNNAEQMRRVMQDVRHRLHDALAPDQQKQFDELMRRAPRRPPGATNAPEAQTGKFQRNGLERPRAMTNPPAGWPPTNSPAAITNVPGA